MSMDSPVFAGRAGGTRRQGTTVWCGGCGTRFGAAWLASLDAEASPQLLAALLADGYPTVNTLSCPACGWQQVAVEPVVVHLPEARRMILCVPEAQRHRVDQARLAHLAAVVEDPGAGVPDYAAQPEVVIGLPALRMSVSKPPPPIGAMAALPAAAASPAPGPRRAAAVGVARDRDLAPAPSARPAPVADAVTVPEQLAVAEGSPAVESAPEAAVEPEVELEVEPEVELDVAPPAPQEEISKTLAQPRPASVAAPGVADLLSAVLQSAEPPRLPDAVAAPAGEWADIDQAWALDELADSPAPDDEPTHVVRLDAVLPRASGPRFDAERAQGGEAYLEVEGDAVRAVVRLSPERAARFEGEPVAMRFQLHQTPAGPLASLLLVALDDDGEVTDSALWAFDPEVDEHQAALTLLESVFAVEVVVHTAEGFHGRRTLRAPLEANVGTAIGRLADATEGDHARARALVAAPDFDQVGRLKHNFTEDSFESIPDAAQARLALGILSYWTAPERREYLLRVRSFPEVWFEAMTRRVLAAGLYYGLAMEPHLRQRCVELGLAAHSAQLLQRCVANFAEVNLNLRPSGLDPLDIWENWEALLTLAEELDLPVDEDIEEVAAQAMERARLAAHEVEVIDLDDDLSVEVEEVAELGEPDDQELVRQLASPGRRLEAALILVQRGHSTNVGPVFNAMTAMGRDELLRLVPALLAMGPAFEASLIIGLRSRRPSLRLACALALGEIRSERAAAAMLSGLLEASRSEWPLLARAVARIGRRIITPAARVVAERGDPGGRVAQALALLGTEARGALAAARAQAESPAVDACFERALAEVGQVGFGDPADFTERLAEAFRGIGPDPVSPDHEEALSSLDLGPGASVSLEADVDLDDLDRSGSSRS